MSEIEYKFFQGNENGRNQKLVNLPDSYSEDVEVSISDITSVLVRYDKNDDSSAFRLEVDDWLSVKEMENLHTMLGQFLEFHKKNKDR